MLILTVDIGNTNITLGVFKGKELLFESRMETNRSRLRDQYAIELRDILDLYGISPRSLEGAIVCSVVPALTNSFVQAITMLSGKQPLIVGPGIKTGLNIRIDNPAQLGADLVAGAVAAIAMFETPSIIFDLGTATTISVIGSDGSFLGGPILPGAAISLEALTNRAAQLPQINMEAPPKVIGTNTVHSMQSGTIYGTASMIDGMIERIEEELGQKATVIATGGIANLVCRHCKRDIVHCDKLILDGLRILFEKNKHLVKDLITE